MPFGAGQQEPPDRLEFRVTQVTADQSVGRLLSWLTGRKSIGNADSPTSAAVGTLVSWVTGKKKGR